MYFIKHVDTTYFGFRMKITDDDSKALPEKYQVLQSKVDNMLVNQSSISDNMSKISKVITNIQTNFNEIQRDTQLLSSENSKIEGKVTRIKQDIELLTKISKTNEESITSITDILATLNITTSAGQIKINASDDSSQWLPLNNGRP